MVVLPPREQPGWSFYQYEITEKIGKTACFPLGQEGRTEVRRYDMGGGLPLAGSAEDGFCLVGCVEAVGEDFQEEAAVAVAFADLADAVGPVGSAAEALHGFAGLAEEGGDLLVVVFAGAG